MSGEVQSVGMLDQDAIEAQIQAALASAGKHRGVAKIARELGLPPQSLYDYGSKGFLGKDSKKLLIKWLTENDYLKNSRPQDPFASALARELRGLADMLESNALDPEAKAIRFRDAILSYYKTLEHYGVALKKAVQGGELNGHD